ncbi:PDR/VanB family oxidoreductase [Burkholderia gladioli]|uniref:Oxidoreductase n=1 Tax=Burkholderia gladioli (strain BSR3) TaxID=999541 RepID=F2LCE2_BURGS|nr:PDR/VanB family oxidoreductase [Burkholderia gladioli]AEA60194.1 Oxidoreductase [Burkholderia gladioli BSR3]MBW5287285.1 oxidoreductase [Burkholderia gladioli]
MHSSSSFKVRVDALCDEAQDIRSFRIVRIDGQAFDAHEPGAHIDVTAPSGVTRQYSLCGDPSDRDTQLFAVKKESESRGGSRSLHDDVKVGSELTVGTPRNLFRLADQARHHVLIGAGIGITPLLSMAYRLAASGASFELHYFARSEAHAAFLPTLRLERLAPQVHYCFGVAPTDLEAALRNCLADAGSGTHIYTCGPGPFMDKVVEVGEAVVGPDAVHLERFAAEPVAASDGALDNFEVEVSGSGQVVQVGKGETIVVALARIGIEIDTSCGEGVCGTCIVDVVDGEPEHRDNCLSKAERASNQVICCCVSRSRSKRLVLDV